VAQRFSVASRIAAQRVLAQLKHGLAIRTIGGASEHVIEQRFESLGRQTVKVVLAVAAAVDESGRPKQGKMMAHRGLALPQLLAQSSYVMLFRLKKQAQDPQSRVVGQKLEQVAQLVQAGI
jgi:hypothetical protein